MSIKHNIYKNLQEIVDPAHTALVVWDVQNGLVKTAFDKAVLIPNLKSLIDAARSKNVPVIYTKINPVGTNYESPWRLYLQMKRFGVDDPEKIPAWMAPGTTDGEIHSEVAPQKSDFVLNKPSQSIFIGTYFENMMRNRGITTLLFTGLATEMGVDSSVRDSSARGFYTIVIEDCVSSSDKEMHDCSLKTLRKVCLVMPSKDVIKEWN